MAEGYDVAVVGATGAVGEALVEILEERQFPVRTLHLLASERSEGKRVQKFVYRGLGPVTAADGGPPWPVGGG